MRPAQPAVRLAFTAAADLMTLPRPIEIVEGVAQEGCVTVLVSESGTGKTFVLLNLSAAVSANLPWHGRATRQGSVAYLSFEGDALGVRLRALRDIDGHRLDHVYIVRPRDPLSPRIGRDGEERALGELAVQAALEALVAELDQAGRPPVRLVIIDTVRASMAGSEDSSEAVSAYLRAVRRLTASVPRAATILAHHAGWQDGDTQRKRERGSSAWRGNVDTTLYLEAGPYDAVRGQAELTLRNLKARDAEKAPPLHLLRRRVELCETHPSRAYEPVTSCVIASDPRTRADREAADQTAVDREKHEADVSTLRVIADHPDLATSAERIRVVLGSRKQVVADSLTRLVQRGWAVPGKRSQPYTVTDAGRDALGATR